MCEGVEIAKLTEKNNKLVCPCVWFRLPLYTPVVLVAVQEAREFLRRSQGP